MKSWLETASNAAGLIGYSITVVTLGLGYGTKPPNVA